jgi:SAM-dependent methyltransferase
MANRVDAARPRKGSRVVFDACLGATADGVADEIDAQVMNAEALVLEDASFDAAFCLFGFMFFPDRARAFGELKRVLKPGDHAVVLTASSSNSSSVRPCLAFHVTRQMSRRALSAVCGRPIDFHIPTPTWEAITGGARSGASIL